MEEIIIDGVNVWSCKHYDLENNYCDQSYLGEGGLLKNTKNPKRCECSPNCYYKQLKRLEQENEKLKKYIKDLQVRKDRYYLQALEYKKSLEEIRGIINNYIKCFYGSCKDYCLYYQECDICDCSKYHISKINEVLQDENNSKYGIFCDDW